MPKKNLEWQLQRMYCPNCRQLIVGFMDKDGTIKITCENCRLVMVRKTMGRRHDRIDIYASHNQVRI